MTPGNLYLLTPREFFNKLEGHRRVATQQRQDAWEQARFTATAIINVWLDKPKKIEPRDLVKFPWDEPKKKQYMTTEQFEALIR